jgi:hypothetical protein
MNIVRVGYMLKYKTNWAISYENYIDQADILHWVEKFISMTKWVGGESRGIISSEYSESELDGS